MTSRTSETPCEDLRALFHLLRDEEVRQAPPFIPLRWIREEPEPRRVRRRTLALAAVAGTLVTMALAGWVAGWRMRSPWVSGAPQDERRLIVVKKFMPPPSIETRRSARGVKITRKVPLPDPTPSEPEPVSLETPAHMGGRRYATPAPPVTVELGAPLPPEREPAREIDLRRAPDDVEPILGVPEPPPPNGPLIPGIGRVTNPTLVPSSRVKPVYPPLARQARMSGNVILQAVVTRDGDVREVQVLRVDHPGLGFEESAVEAIRQWRYEPALQDGEPVDVCLTINVDYELGEGETVPPGIPPFDYTTDSYAAIEDNPFHRVIDEPLSTFSADVDTASYSIVRRYLSLGRRPPRDAVRVEELINYFDYERPEPAPGDPVGVGVEVAACPWTPDHRLAKITLAGWDDGRRDYRGSNLVFLLDVSGSMEAPDRLPLVRESLSMLADELDARDTVSIVVYAGASGLVLPPTSGADRQAIKAALHRLRAGGSTAGAAGLELAYEVARDNLIEGGVNRVILATDGDFNVGVTSHRELLRIIEEDARRGIHFTALGYGMGNYHDDRLEKLADHGNGNYAYIDDLSEARKVLVEEAQATLVTVAKDVKIQVEFNPAEVGSYRLIGYVNRMLEHRDFDDDRKDAGEVGAGHTVTVLYELTPPEDPPSVETFGGPGEGELLTLKIRYKRPDEETSVLQVWPVRDEGGTLRAASDDFRFAASVAAFGMRLRENASVQDFGWSEIERLAAGAIGFDEFGHRARFEDLVRTAGEIAP